MTSSGVLRGKSLLVGRGYKKIDFSPRYSNRRQHISSEMSVCACMVGGGVGTMELTVWGISFLLFWQGFRLSRRETKYSHSITRTSIDSIFHREKPILPKPSLGHSQTRTHVCMHTHNAHANTPLIFVLWNWLYFNKSLTKELTASTFTKEYKEENLRKQPHVQLPWETNTHLVPACSVILGWWLT